MKKFKAELEKLLDKYPDLGGFTIHISPRVKIEMDHAPLVSGLTPLQGAQIGTPGIIAEVKKKRPMMSDGILALESSVSLEKVEKLKKLAGTE